MSAELRSTKARVREPQQVQAILNSYKTACMHIELCENDTGWFLAPALDRFSPGWEEWPLALHQDQYPTDEQYPDEDEWWDALDSLYDEKGAEGFLQLLRDLAPFLESPLLIRVANYCTDGCMTRAWIVQPGATKVQTLFEFDGALAHRNDESNEFTSAARPSSVKHRSSGNRLQPRADGPW